MIKWEYELTAHLTIEELMHILNKHGKLGLELATIIEIKSSDPKHRRFMGIMKRPLE